MRTKTVSRYYCDHCKKSGGQRAAMERHEKGCTLNPDRYCRMCDRGNAEHAPIAILIAAAREGLAALQKAADGCPACTLAGIRQLRKADPGYWDDEGYSPGGAPDSLGEFNWKTAVKEFWDTFREED